MFGQVHCDLPWVDDGARVVFRLDLNQSQPELFGDCLLNGFNRDFPGLRVDKVFENLLCVRQGDLSPNQRRVRDQPD